MSVLCLLTACTTVQGLPPLGLTQIDRGAEGGALVSIFDGVAYLSTTVRDPSGTIWVVAPNGTVGVRTLSHPELGSRAIPTRVVRGPDGGLHVGARILPMSPPSFEVTGSALFALTQPMIPVATWLPDATTGGRPSIIGLDRDLRGVGSMIFGNSTDGFNEFLPFEFLTDETVVPLEVPEDDVLGRRPFGLVASVSESGFAVGQTVPPDAIGTVGAIWSPDGKFSFLTSLAASSVRDRTDGLGVNIGSAFDGAVIYGDSPDVRLTRLGDGTPTHFSDGPTIVAQTEFAVVNQEAPAGVHHVFAFYPGIVPEDADLTLPIEQVFPELATINFDGVSDLYAVDGRIYMTLYGEDGLYLFGARDPSVIPEPSTVALALLLAGGVLGCRRTRFRRNWDASAVC